MVAQEKEHGISAGKAAWEQHEVAVECWSQRRRARDLRNVKDSLPRSQRAGSPRSWTWVQSKPSEACLWWQFPSKSWHHALSAPSTTVKPFAVMVVAIATHFMQQLALGVLLQVTCDYLKLLVG